MHRSPTHWPRAVLCALLVACAALLGCKSSTPADDQAGAPTEARAEATPQPPADDAQAATASVEGGASPSTRAEAAAEEAPAPGPDGRPTVFADGTPRQQELLGSAMSKLEEGDTDAAAMYTLVLTGDDQPPSMEKLIGLLLLAEIYRVEDKPEKAIERLESAREAFPPSVELPATLAELYSSTGDMDRVAENLRSALAIDPDRIDLIAALAAALQHSGDQPAVSDAVARYDAALERIRGELAAPTTPAERRVELMQALAGVRDERATKLLVEQMGHADVEVVSQAFELVVNHGHVEAIPMMEARKASEQRPEIQEALGQAIDYMHELQQSEDLPDLPTMPPE